MIVNIKRIVKKTTEQGQSYLVVYFDYFNEEHYTYLTRKSLDYWKSKGVTKLNKETKINVIKKKESGYFQIIDIK